MIVFFAKISLLIFSILVFRKLLYILIKVVKGARSIEALSDVNCHAELVDYPMVSIVVAARNEERDVKSSLLTMLNQSYPAFEVIVVNDRSTDNTGAIIDSLAIKNSRLHAIHISELPDGWIGKNYALYQGAKSAKGKYIIFCDADVQLADHALKYAISYVISHDLSHLTSFPSITTKKLIIKLFISCFSVFLNIRFQPWKMKDPSSHLYVGIGPFNLVERDAYEASGTHAAIAMEPIDDVMLATIIGKKGFKQDVVWGHGIVSFPWYSSFRDLLQGVKKNSFAAFGYNIFNIIRATISILIVFLGPIALLVTSFNTTPIMAVNSLSIVVILLLYAHGARTFQINPWLSMLYPVSIVLFLYVLWNAVCATMTDKAIDWRGRQYSLTELRAQKQRS